MLNQFYNYLSEKLTTFFKEQSLAGGERFYLQFDDESQVDEFYQALKQQPNAEEFEYQHEQGSPYYTFCLVVGDIKVVVAATVDNVTPDFLVTLRNKVGEQTGKLENTALLSICHETLDSIRGGSSDLQKEGMPLHVKSITKTLKQEIEQSDLTKKEKEVANFYLRKKLENMILQPSLSDFAEVLALLSQGTINKYDYPALGLFYDDQLEQYTPSQMRKRLEENHVFFEKVQHIHEYENLDQQLEKSFDDKGVTRLKKDDWKDVDYSFVKDSNEKLIVQSKKSLEYLESNSKKTEEGLIYWEKPFRETKAGERKRHIIIFNADKKGEINITFEFDERLRKEFIHKKSKDIASTSNKKLKIKLEHSPGETTFYKVVYKHNNETKSTFEFNIAIVECSPEFLKSIQTQYEIKENERRIVIHNDGDNIYIGPEKQQVDECYIEEQDETVDVSSEKEGIEISTASPAWSDESLLFQLKTAEFTLPFKIKDQISKSTPVVGKQIWKLKREKQGHFLYDNGKLQIGTQEYYPREEFKYYLLAEEKWITENMFYANKTASGIEAKHLELPEPLKESYQQLVEYYQSNNLLPSLAYMDEKLRTLAQSYVNVFNESIRSIEENVIITEQQKNLLKLGMIKEKKRIYLTPLHPLNVAYQLAIYNQLSTEYIEQHILDRLRPNNLLPFIYGENDMLYRPVVQYDASEWILYQPMKQVTVGESNAYLANVVEEKLHQFVDHFQYLFLEGANSPLKINVINITNDLEVLKGLFNFVKERIEKYGPNHVLPLEVALYQDTDILSSFETFSIYDDIDLIEEKLDISLDSKVLDPSDMLRIIRENIRYYKIIDNGEYNYAHISFYKMASQDSHAKDNMEEMETGLSLNGLLSSVTSVTGRQDYRTGFGKKNVLNNHDSLIETSSLLNELAGNLQNEGSNPYRKNESIVTRTSSLKEELLNSLYDSSYWVTFIDPNVGLDFFQRSERNLLIIHYSDQYTSSSQFDAITVTDKSSQYRHVIKQYLEEEYISADDEKINSAIRAFNAINGEWLLRIIGSKGQFSREKLSIISAIKYTLSFLDMDNIVWIPISLEEILRVAGVVKLTKSEGIFSAKNLGVKGSTSDDLLLVGMELIEDKEVFLHFYPVEVKVGLNSVSTIGKAKDQITTTRKLLDEQLRIEDEDGNIKFKNKFFRNFFVQMFLANAQKFIANQLWPEKSFDVIDKVKAKLLNDDYQIGYHFRPYIGKGMILSFKKEATWRSAVIENDTLILELSEEDAYSGVIEEIETIRTRIHKGKTDINTSILLENSYQSNGERLDDSLKVAEEKEKYGQTSNDNQGEKLVDAPEEGKKPNVSPEIKVSKKKDVKDVRVLLGSVQGSTHKIYWEYGNQELANRHILISGKSGQGKTYFIQCLLMELATNDVSSIIFDYTGGFKKSKLEPEFKDYLGDRLEQILVARDKFPINPFKLNQKELDEGEYIQEDFSDVADRMKSVFAAIYKDLGIQQLNAIYQAIMNGLRKYGDGMNMEMLRSELAEDTSGPAKTALSQLNPMIDKDPFDNSRAEFNWGELDKGKGKVFIIQLTGFATDIQKVITEFILWDLWYYKLQHGDQSIPLPVILDEAQNLDHSDKSPSAKILTEGRKFGWSGWYATQFLKGLLSTDEIARLQNSSQKVYFLPPENEVNSIAGNLSHDQASKKEWEKKLVGLNKGQCISYGPTIGRDGKLTQGEPVVVNITSLSERIRLLEE
ncbi:DNA phosphorothioation-dependent restriction protein DptH [Oceanobacillus salinisoli]|uniref:DNA phosphorothioation-dependent restriction protein DptH n=1 Tax=Oceanobacillus salinisoli TaxID=2678611 RepID=UPI0012E25899|nr:DNA phosphorothioation-dependent restriction protein DptH [Oceanobacillus salinisoli]